MSKPVGKPAGRREELTLDQLMLDARNPRFGGLTADREQADILDHIVETFTVDDVLSSLAVNGYFDAEPMVCRKEKDGAYIVVEGNRRLSACLILTEDQRAARQQSKSAQYRKIWLAHGQNRIEPVPCIVFEEGQQQELLSYLGVRHIASAQPWDSYAKAAWVAEIVEKSGLSLADVALMIGDQHKTIARLLEGYNMMRQVTEARLFVPADSVKRGRGSVSDYPFSWVYTMLGYSAVRRFLELSETDRSAPPLKEEALPKAALVLRSMFGDRSTGRNGAIDDSRQIGSLAAAFGSQEKIGLLEAGKSLREIERQTQPIDERLRQGLTEIRDIHRDINAALSEDLVNADVADGVIGLARVNKAAAAKIHGQLEDLTAGSDDD